MARLIYRLTARGIAGLNKPGLHADGRGLYLRVEPTQAKRWAFIFFWERRRREMGLGNILDLSLADARAAAANARRLVKSGIDPIENRRLSRQPTAPMPRATFREVAVEVLDMVAASLTNPKHIEQWRTSLLKTAEPLASMSTDAITTDDVLAVLKPVWTKTPESASRLRGRIERVLDTAKAKGLRSGDNPARWKGHLDILLPPRKRLPRGHLAALPVAGEEAFEHRRDEFGDVGLLPIGFSIDRSIIRQRPMKVGRDGDGQLDRGSIGQFAELQHQVSPLSGPTAATRDPCDSGSPTIRLQSLGVMGRPDAARTE